MKNFIISIIISSLVSFIQKKNIQFNDDLQNFIESLRIQEKINQKNKTQNQTKIQYYQSKHYII